MKKIYFFLTIGICIMCLPSNLSAQLSRLLNIPGRAQWNGDGGYCGEESVQMIGLYYGNYISEIVCRNVAGGWFLVGDNDVSTLDKLSFTCKEWDYNQATPQYQAYLVWVKQQLFLNHPVIITVFMQGMSDPDYDHIIPAIGFSATDTIAFHNTDQLMFNDCFASSYFTRSFQSVWDTRSMNGNGASYTFCIPKNVDYACAVTGIKDLQHQTKPVHISLDNWDEPDVTQGQSPVLMNATISIDSLNPGVKYALLSYDNYTTVPASGFSPAGASDVVYFIASGATQTFTDSFMSNTAVFYRCIPYNFSSGLLESSIANKCKIYPNPADDYLIVESPVNATIEIINTQGQAVKKLEFTNAKNLVAIKEFTAGIYTVRIQTNNGVAVKKFIKE